MTRHTPTNHLRKHQAHSPHVHPRPVAARAIQQLRSPVPAGGHGVGVHGPLSAIMGPCKPKVRELHPAFVCEQDVGGLDVAVDDSCSGEGQGVVGRTLRARWSLGFGSRSRVSALKSKWTRSLLQVVTEWLMTIEACLHHASKA